MTVSWDNVLILQSSFLGDTVLTLPLISEVRRRFPVKKLSILCLPPCGELLTDHPGIDEIITDDKKSTDRGWRGLRRTAARLKKKNFSLALTPHKSLRSALILYFAKIPHRVGFRESSGWFLFHQRAVRDSARHDVERNLSILSAFGLAPEDCERSIELPVSASTRASVDRQLRALGVNDGDFIIGLSPGSVWATKRWSTAGFAALISMLRSKYDCKILLFGGASDIGVVEEIQKRGGGAAISLIGRIELRELAAAISRCRILITNDSAPMHIAVARKVPTVAVFCATTPELGFYPYSNDAIVIQKNLSCRPCGSHGGRRCPLATADCIREVAPEAVFQAVEKLLERLAGDLRTSLPSFQPEFITL
jgi:lipopolysaccharide heptosyltransferase II